MNFSKIIAAFFVIYGISLATSYYDDIVQFDQEWDCGSYNFLGECTFLVGPETTILLLGIMTLSYYFDGEFRTRKRNISSVLIIIYLSIGIGTEVTEAMLFAVFGFLAAFDGGKNSGMMLNETYKLELVKKSLEAVDQSLESSNRNGEKQFGLDGIIGFGILSTTGLAVSASLDILSLEIVDIIFPTITYDGITYNIHNVSIILSLLLVFYRSSRIAINRIFKNRYLLKIPKYEVILLKISILLKVLTIILFILGFGEFIDRFLVFIGLIELQPFVQACMLLLWGFGYFINR